MTYDRMLKDQNRWFVLDGKRLVPSTMFDAAMFAANPGNVILRRDTIGDAWVSTVFLPLNHGVCRGSADPVCFETMIFGGTYDRHQQRYSTYDEAISGHIELVTLLIKADVIQPIIAAAQSKPATPESRQEGVARIRTKPSGRLARKISGT